ncbi:MAG: hypothetical protein J3Q66DRAFT_351498 [Benniella sp.]|nr:MAG: hypothetical protein J3Q66DRAFT_351498 [Benniella sp.]
MATMKGPRFMRIPLLLIPEAGIVESVLSASRQVLWRRGASHMFPSRVSGSVSLPKGVVVKDLLHCSVSSTCQVPRPLVQGVHECRWQSSTCESDEVC